MVAWPISAHLGGILEQLAGNMADKMATWRQLGRTWAELGRSWGVLGRSWEGLGGLGAVNPSVKGVKAGVHGADLRIARALWKTKSSKKRSLQSLKVV